MRYLFLITFLFSSQLFSTPIQIEGTEKIINLGQNVEYFLAPDSLSFDEIKKVDFIKSESRIPNFGIQEKNAWIRFAINSINKDKKIILEISNSTLDRLEVFIEYDDGELVRKHISREAPFNKREIDYPTPAFFINLRKGVNCSIYLMAESSHEIILPINIFPAETFSNFSSKESIFTGVYFGVLLVMLLYNLFVYFAVKDKSYLYYVNYIFWVCLTQLSVKGYTFQYLWPNAVFLEKYSLEIISAFGGASATLFIKHFLPINEYLSKKYVYIFNILIGLFFVSPMLSLLGFSHIGWDYMVNITFIATLFLSYVAILLFRKNVRSAKFFLVAWSVLFSGSIVYLFKIYGVLPHNFFTDHSMQIASALEVTLLSFALADKINVLTKEKEISQRESLLMAKENERIIREQNIVLEQKVTERTAELQQTNEELNTTLENLKDTQAQLVDSEKMASLGQLTAGIAHEINNPINFVTSNITPLKHDVSDIMELIDKYEEIKSPEALEQKLKEISALKEEIDLDYLKTEIDSLLKGIQEGAERTSEIVRGLKNFSRLDEDDLKKASINEGIDSTLTILNNKLKDNIVIHKYFVENSVIDCYPGKINQLLMNIINNGIQAIEAKEGYQRGEGNLIITTKTEGDELMLSIKDNGVGMDEATIKKVFDPFYTTKEVGKGTGLGMSIVYKIIENHKGRITIDSKVGEGTTVSIFLPIKANV